MPIDNEKGFSLVELLVAITILAVGLLGTATMLSTGIGGDSFAERMTVENSLASSVMEEIMARPGSDTTFSSTVSNAVYDLDTASAATTRTVQDRVYSATYSITTNNPVTGTARVDVTISNGTRSVVYTNIKSLI